MTFESQSNGLPRVLLAHPGTQYSHQLARQLYRQGLLDQFWTGIALCKESLSTRALSRALPVAYYKRIANRVISGVPKKYIRLLPFVELAALRRIRRGDSEQSVLHERNELFQSKIPESAIKNVSALIGFDTSSWILTEKALGLGRQFFLDQSAAHPLVNHDVYETLATQFPEWRSTSEGRLPKVLASERIEHQLASKIVVASSYTKRTLVNQGVAEDKIVVNSFGVDLDTFHPPEDARRRSPLRFLFLGSVSAHKGIPLLIDAWRSLAGSNAELWIVGPIAEQHRVLIPNLPGLYVKGKYAFEDLPELLRQCDVLVFPSFSEGFGLVLLEALASGMPIITTENTAAPDLITNGREGFLLRAGDSEALREALESFTQQTVDIDAMSVAARKCAQSFTWDRYGERWASILKGN